MAWYSWSRTAANNGTADSTINWQEGMAPSAVNDSGRAMMARTADYRDDVAGSLLTTGTSTAFIITSNEVFDTLAHLSGQTLTIRFHTASGAAPTLNIDGLGAKALQSASGAAIATGLMAANSVWSVTYDDAIPAFLVRGVSAASLAAGTGAAATIAFAAGPRVLGAVTAGNGVELSLGGGLSANGTTLSGTTPVPGAFKNLSIKVASGTTVTVAADFVTTTDGTSYQTTALSGTVDLGSNGAANKLDTGTIAIDTWYAIWAIAKADGTTAGLASTSFTAPTLPTGYTYKVRLGAVRTVHATATLFTTWQLGRTAQFIIGTSGTTHRMAVGNVGTTLTAVATGGFVPTTASRIFVCLWLNASGSQAGVAPNANYTGNNSDSIPLAFFAPTVTNLSGSIWLLLESTNIYWFSDNAGNVLNCLGWEDNI